MQRKQGLEIAAIKERQNHLPAEAAAIVTKDILDLSAKKRKAVTVAIGGGFIGAILIGGKSAAVWVAGLWASK